MDLLLSVAQAANETIPPAVEAAQMTISNASENAKLAAYVAMGGAIISLVGTSVSTYIARLSAKEASRISKDIAEGNQDSLEKRRLIDTISTQRIEWINNVRNHFVEFNALCSTFCMIMLKKKKDQEKGIENVTINMKDYLNIEKAKNQIELFLNPREKFVDKLITALNEMYDGLVNDPTNISLYKKNREEIIFLQQIVLKAEWKRIKRETEEGRQLTNKETDDIFHEIAKDIDNVKYRKIFS